MVLAPLVALALAAAPAEAGRLPPAPREIYTIAWAKRLVPTEFGDFQTQELGGVAVDPTGQWVVVGTRDGWLHALHADGRLAWDFQGHGPFAGQPLIDGGVVYAGCHDGNLYALDLATGTVRWTYDAREQLATRPALVNGLVVVASLQDTVFAVDAATGAWRWHHRRDLNDGFTILGAASVQVDGGHVYAAYSDGTVTRPRGGHRRDPLGAARGAVGPVPGRRLALARRRPALPGGLLRRDHGARSWPAGRRSGASRSPRPSGCWPAAGRCWR